jgi:hypothetical protein
MDVTESHLVEIEKSIIEVIVRSLEEQKLSEQDLPKIAEFVLNGIKNIKDHEQIVAFLYGLSSNWPVFDHLEEIERGEMQDTIEDKGEKEVLSLAKNGNIEEAIRLAKSMTE